MGCISRLCPVDNLLDFIGKDKITHELLGEAAEHFRVSSLVPALQLHNKGLLPIDLDYALPLATGDPPVPGAA
jgi:hypothetical protein